MTESESPRRVKITRSMAGRLAAVGLFLCLGTLAVMHTVTSRRATTADAETPDEAATATNAESELAATPEQPPSSTTKSPLLTDGNSKPDSSIPAKSTSFTASSNKLPASPTIPGSTAPRNGSSFSLGDPADPSSNPPARGTTANLTAPQLPEKNSSSLSLPPPTRSFGDALKSPPSTSDPPAKDDAPIASAQIQVETDPDAPNNSQPPIRAPNSRFGSVPSTTGNAGLPRESVPGSGALSNSMGLSLGDAPKPPAAPPSIPDTSQNNARPLAQSTPYDPPEKSAGPPAVNPQSISNPSGVSAGVSNDLRSPATTSPFGSSSGAASTLGASPNKSPTETFNANSGTARSALPSANPSSPPLSAAGSSTSTSGLNPRASNAAAIPPSAPRQIESIPGAANLEGPQTPSLKLQKIAPREVQINKPTELQLIVQNAGQVPANQVMVYDRIPDGTELIETTPQATRAADGTLSWNLGTLAPGETSKISLQLMPQRPGEFGSVAHVSFAAQATSRTLCTQPILAVDVTSAPKVLIGDDVVLDIVVENKGDGPATNVMLQEDVPDLLSFEDGSHELEFEIGTLAPGQKRSVQLRLKASKVGMTQNHIAAQGDAGLEARDAIEIEVVAPELQVAGEGPARKYLNRQATHSFAVNNAGTATANNVDLVAKLPRGLKFVQANNHGQYDSNAHSVVWSLQQLTAGQTGRVELVTLPIEPGDQKIDFEATADLNQKAAVSKSLFVDYLVELFCEIDDLADPIEIDGETAYRIKVVNQGLQAATNIRLNVDFPPGIQPISVSGNIEHQIQGQRVVFSPIERLDTQQESTVTITAKGISEGDHRVVVSMSSDARETQIAKEESTRVYSDQ